MPNFTYQIICKHENAQYGHKWCPEDHYYEYVNHDPDTCACCLAKKQIKKGKYVQGACKICLNC
jgi:hypothetical protein|uniref:Uncharacterized protein n=1 Tax=Mimiviridae sp. ChoanoV1 TaxID=2596887 RepID=A0A5B8HWN8_9VIRU|nr:hypothetical protein 4_73 [Mimiviridae sp. ChoanoV1]